MPDQEQDRPTLDPIRDLKAAVGFAILVARCLAVPHELLWRVPGTVGRRYFGLQALIGWLFALPLAAWLVPPDPRETWVGVAWTAQTLLLLVHRAARLLRKTHAHSYYIGDSWIARLFGIPQERARGPGEMLGCLILFAILVPVDQTLACSAILGGGANLIHLALIDARDRRAAENAVDARIETEIFIDRLREIRR